MKKLCTPALVLVLIINLAGCNAKTDNKPPEPPKEAFDEATEIAAIMNVIKGETDCFFKGDYECWAKHWSHEAYAYQGWNNDDGSADAAVGWDKINAQGKNWIEKYYKNGKNVIHPVVKKDKPLVKFFNEKSAYLIWTQYNADKEKTNFRTSQETRIMEKTDDGWKIVNVTALWDTRSKIPFDSLQLD